MRTSSRERMLQALECKPVDDVPCSFMLFKALREQCRDQAEFVERQLELGLDPTVAIPVRPMRRSFPMPELGNLRGLPVEFPPDVEVRDWREHNTLHRQYKTPAGSLSTAVELTEDFTHSDRLSLFDDYVIPRATKRLVMSEQDLLALRHILAPPSPAHVAQFRQEAQQAKKLAERHDLPVVGEWGVLFDAACWLCGMEEIVLAMMEQPSFAEELFAIIATWNRSRMEVVLEEGVDLFIRRGWYETADFLSPDMYERFVLPHIQGDVQCANRTGTRVGTITTSSIAPLLDLLLQTGIDVLIGIDPLQDARADFALLKEKAKGRLCLWGGVNGCLTVEMGTEMEVRRAVAAAMESLAPGGGLILSPVDNILHLDDNVWNNIHAFIDEWRRIRA